MALFAIRCLKEHLPLREKYLEFFWSVFSRVRTEYGEILRISPYSVRMPENTDQKNSEYEHFSQSVCVSKDQLQQCIHNRCSRITPVPNIFRKKLRIHLCSCRLRETISLDHFFKTMLLCTFLLVEHMRELWCRSLILSLLNWMCNFSFYILSLLSLECGS